MAWPFPHHWRDIVRAAAYWLQEGLSAAATVLRMQTRPYTYTPAEAEESTEEAERALYFAQRLRDAPPSRTFGRTWFGSARGAWYAAYGRAPTMPEADWAFTRPEGMLGVYVRVTGRGAWSGRYTSRTVKVNVGWGRTWEEVQARVRALMVSREIDILRHGSEPVFPAGIEMSIERGALLEFDQPTVTLP
jgi:hypothetical protein